MLNEFIFGLLLLFSKNPNSDQLLISPYKISTLSIMRIEKMNNNSELPYGSLNTFSQQV